MIFFEKYSRRVGERKLSRFAAAFALSLGAIITLQTTIAPARADDLATVKIAADPSGKPFAFMDSDKNQMDGFDIDMMKAIGKIAGFKVEILPLDFAGIIPALQSGTADAGASSITITDARKKVIDFTDPYYDAGLQLLVRSDNADVAKIEDLKGKTLRLSPVQPVTILRMSNLARARKSCLIQARRQLSWP